MAKKPKRTAVRAKTDKPAARKAFPLIGRTDLRSLLDQVSIYMNRAASANGSMGELIRDYVKRKHLHAGAFRIVNRWKRLGERDPQALWLELAHVDDMREKAGIDRLAKEQGQLLPAVSEDERGLEPNPNVVPYEPREVDEQAGAA